MYGYGYDCYTLKRCNADTFWCDGHNNHEYYEGYYWSNDCYPEFLCNRCHDFRLLSQQGGSCIKCQRDVQLTLNNFDMSELMCNNCNRNRNPRVTLTKSQKRNLRRKRAKERKNQKEKKIEIDETDKMENKGV
jgi:hypothetical protein